MVADASVKPNRAWSDWLATACALLAAICAGIGFRYVFLAGCAADLKVGLGNPLEALRLENISMLWLAGSSVLFGLATGMSIAWLFRHSFAAALLEGVIPAGIVWVLFWFAALEVEGYGIESCGIYGGI